MLLKRQRGLTTLAVLVGMLLLLVAVGACSNGDDKSVELLNDPKFGLAHLNDAFHTIKGDDLLANPKFGLAHLNDEFHAIKQMLADVAQQIESLRQQVQ